MKKTICLFLTAVLAFSAGCAKKEVKQKKETDKKPAPITEEVKNDAFYDMMQENTRPVAVMIDNDVAASRPQIGLESAYMVY